MIVIRDLFITYKAAGSTKNRLTPEDEESGYLRSLPLRLCGFAGDIFLLSRPLNRLQYRVEARINPYIEAQKEKKFFDRINRMDRLDRLKTRPGEIHMKPRINANEREFGTFSGV